jgi:hypothetical protein
MSFLDGSPKRETFTCPQCGEFLWTEGLCDGCQGAPPEAEVPSNDKVIYKYDPAAKKVTAKARK